MFHPDYHPALLSQTIQAFVSFVGAQNKNKHAALQGFLQQFQLLTSSQNHTEALNHMGVLVPALIRTVSPLQDITPGREEASNEISSAILSHIGMALDTLGRSTYGTNPPTGEEN